VLHRVSGDGAHFGLPHCLGERMRSLVCWLADAPAGRQEEGGARTDSTRSGSPLALARPAGSAAGG
jgi:hypothetical protein